MTRYEPRLRVDIGHAYYADGRARGLRFSPCTQTAAWLRANEAVWRDTGSGLALSAPARLVNESAEALTWWVRSEDPLWANITGDVGTDLQWVPLLRPPTTARGDAAAEVLHAGTTVAADALMPLVIPGVLAGLAEARPQPQRPVFVLQVPPPDLTADPPQPARYRATFAARALLWQYRLMDSKWKAAELRVVELIPGADGLSQHPAFNDLADWPLASGLTVPTIRSKQPIALQERPERRFQLRIGPAASDRPLIDRLPMAGAEQFVRETIGGLPTLVSEIFVHR